MDPSRVRTQILQDHASLRQQLSELEVAVDEMLTDQSKTPTVRVLARQILVELTRHTHLEDTILVPVLRTIDAWGSVRSAQLLAHHKAQRAQIQELTELYNLPLQAQDIALATRTLAMDLRADMEHEERDILSADLLRDDVVALSAESG